ELLVVIAIIGILVSLLMAAVMKALVRGEEAQTRSDISQLAQGVTAFMSKFGLQDPPPSRLWLSSRKSDYNMANPLHKDSYEYLTRVWPRLAWIQNPNAVIPWGGNPSGVELQGHQCLVFILGGIPVNNPAGCIGFSPDPANPAAPLKTGENRISFFDFKSNRLVDAGGGYYGYKDPYGKMPYAYFRSYKTHNSYKSAHTEIIKPK